MSWQNITISIYGRNRYCIAAPLDLIEVEVNDKDMNGPNSMSEQTAIALLASNEALQVAVSSIQSGQQVLQGTVQTLQGDVHTLQGTVSTLQGTVNTLQSTVNTLQSTVNTLQSTVQTLHSNVQILQITVEKSQETLQALQRIVEKQQETIIILQTDVAAIKVQLSNCATKADVEAIRAELFKTLSIYTVKAFVWAVTACSALSSAVYFIARNVH